MAQFFSGGGGYLKSVVNVRYLIIVFGFVFFVISLLCFRSAFEFISFSKLILNSFCFNRTSLIKEGNFCFFFTEVSPKYDNNFFWK